MQSNLSIKWSLSFLVLIIFSSLISCSQQPELKIPITTSSEAARQHFIIGRDLADKLRFQESKEYFLKALEADPEFALAHLNLAFAQPSIKSFFSSFNQALNLLENVSEGEQQIILSFEAGAISRDIAKQKEHLQKLIQMYPKDERAHNLLGNFYFGQQNYNKAIAEYNIAVNINPEFSQPYNQLGYSYRFLGNYDEAEFAFEKYITLIPDDPNPYDSYAELLMKVGKFEESIENYRKAIEVNNNFVISYTGVATNFILMGDYESAHNELQEMFDASTDDGQRRAALAATAIAYIDEGKYKKALAILKRQFDIAMSINDTASMANDLIFVGNIFREFGFYQKAQDRFDISLNLVQNSSLSKAVKDVSKQTHLFNSAQIFIAHGKLDRAKTRVAKFKSRATIFENAIQLKQAHLLYGLIALAEKDYKKAINELLQTNEQNPYNFFRIAEAYKGLGDEDNSMKYYQMAASFNGNNNLNYAFIRNQANKILESF